MLKGYNIFKSLRTHSPKMDFNDFQLLSKLPFAPNYNEIKFIPIIHKNSDIPNNPLYFKKTVHCADDMVYHTTREFNDQKNSNIVEYRALGFKDRLQQVMMQASAYPLCSKAKYIIFTCNALGTKYNNNPILGMFENEHLDADPSLRIEYEIYTTNE